MITLDNIAKGQEKTFDKGFQPMSIARIVFYVAVGFSVFYLGPTLLLTFWPVVPDGILAVTVVMALVGAFFIWILLTRGTQAEQDKKDQLILSFLEKNNFVEVSHFLLRDVKNENDAVFKVSEILKNEFQKAGLPDASIEQLPNLERICRWMLPPILEDDHGRNHDSKYTICLQKTDAQPIIAISRERRGKYDWAVALPMNIPSAIANVYVSVSPKTYFGSDDEVIITRIKDRYRLYAASGGGSDTHYISDKLNLYTVGTETLPFDFEFYDTLLIVRQPTMALERITKSRAQSLQLYDPRTIEKLQSQINYILKQLELPTGSYSSIGKMLNIFDDKSIWRHKLYQDRAKILFANVSYWSRTAIVFYILLCLGFIVTAFIAFAIRDFIAN